MLNMKLRFTKALLLYVATIGVLAACDKGQEPVLFQTLEDNRSKARDNAVFLAQRYRATDPRFATAAIVPAGDSSQTQDCPQGDGWATVKFIRDDSYEFKMKCSTYSINIGCIPEGDFKSKPFSSEDGQCSRNGRVPFPIPSMVK